MSKKITHIRIRKSILDVMEYLYEGDTQEIEKLRDVVDAHNATHAVKKVTLKTEGFNHYMSWEDAAKIDGFKGFVNTCSLSPDDNKKAIYKVYLNVHHLLNCGGFFKGTIALSEKQVSILRNKASELKFSSKLLDSIRFYADPAPVIQSLEAVYKFAGLEFPPHVTFNVSESNLYFIQAKLQQMKDHLQEDEDLYEWGHADNIQRIFRILHKDGEITLKLN